MFTCPLDGTYYFAFSVHTGLLIDPFQTTAIHIQRDELRISEAVCSTLGGNYYIRMQCGTSVVLNCNMGQRVFVSTVYDNSALYGDLQTTFSGFLIHTDISPY